LLTRLLDAPLDAEIPRRRDLGLMYFGPQVGRPPEILVITWHLDAVYTSK